MTDEERAALEAQMQQGGMLDFLRQTGAEARQAMGGNAPIPPQSDAAPGGYAANPELPPTLAAEMAPATQSVAAPPPSEGLAPNELHKLKPGEASGYSIWAGDMFGAPKDGQVTFSSFMPRVPGTGGIHAFGNIASFAEGDKREPAKGKWRYLGPDASHYGAYAAGGEQPVADNAKGAWMWEEDAAPAAAAPVEEEQPKKKAERFPEGDIYNDWDYYTKRARADVEGINRMPFTYSDFPNIGQTPAEATQQFYPGAWQEGGVQKIIGPNGTNIAPGLDENLLSIFRDKGIDTASAKDWPSLLDQLMKSGRITSAQRGTLGDLAKKKEPDQSFANQGLANAARG
jgi:hypothetical protein